jgi:hypothetical protein
VGRRGGAHAAGGGRQAVRPAVEGWGMGKLFLTLCMTLLDKVLFLCHTEFHASLMNNTSV